MSPDRPAGRAVPPARDREGAEAPRRRAPLVPAADGVAGKGLDLSVEFLGAIATLGGLGWLLDRWLGTDPWLMLVGFLAGFACGLYLLWLHSRSEEEVEEARRREGQRRQRRRRSAGG
jgi:F0F1-type ATP synthase assembly protein I